MLKDTRLPLLFLFIGSLLGVFLRWQFISPTPKINYAFFLHGHSHIMFLGWIFNVLFIGFTVNNIAGNDRRFFRILFYVLQLFVVGMLVTFPLQGYGVFSIIFSTLHTIGSIVFAILFFRKTKDAATVSVWYAQTALVFFILSTAGPFSLGYLMAHEMGQSNWYYFSIYFYLHFQYNGFFLFGVFSLLFGLIERKGIQCDVKKSKAIGVIFAACCIPAYLLSILWAKPGYLFNLLAGFTALLQFTALVILVSLIASLRKKFKTHFNKVSVIFLIIAGVAFVLKLTLQLLSAFPFVAQMAYELRPVVIAYLHLVLLGVISLSLFVWYFESDLIDKFLGSFAIILYLISFVGMEICLVLTPWWSKFVRFEFCNASACIFVFSVLLSFSCFLILLSSFKKT